MQREEETEIRARTKMEEDDKCCECLNCTCDPCECSSINPCGCDEEQVAAV